MSGSTARLQAVSAVTNYKPISPPLNFAETPASELFGVNVFGTTAMEQVLPKQVFKALKRTLEKGEKLDNSIADVIASDTLSDMVDRRSRRLSRPCAR